MIYFDNAATTFKKPKSVYRCLNNYLKKECGNPGRSSHYLAAKSAEYVYEARYNTARLFNIENPENVIFTMNATYALNMAIKTLLHEKCHIIISDVEHNSVMRPVHALCENTGSDYSVFNSNSENIFFEIEKHIRPDTKAIISTLISNVDGREISFFALSELKKKYNLKLIIDASQAAGHKSIDLGKYAYDAVAMPGHKGLFGIQGAGICIFSENPQKSFVEGGSGIDSKSLTMPKYLPEGLEAGTLPTPAIIALNAGIEYILSVGVTVVDKKLEVLTEALRERLVDNKSVIIYGSNNGIISFNINGIGCEKVAALLDEKKIYTRAGLHCAPLAHTTLGTQSCGTVRASLSIMNTLNEVDAFSHTVNLICKNDI